MAFVALVVLAVTAGSQFRIAKVALDEPSGTRARFRISLPGREPNLLDKTDSDFSCDLYEWYGLRPVERINHITSSNGTKVTAFYPMDSSHRGTVRLVLPDKTHHELSPAMSGSGTRFTNGTMEWWEHQGQATWTVDGTNVFRGELIRAH
jgi:hypothetical protein